LLTISLVRAISRCIDDTAFARVGIHFYTLNKSDATRQIDEYLGVKDSEGLQ